MICCTLAMPAGTAAEADKGGTDWQAIAPQNYPLQRKWVDSQQYPWRAIGRINLAGRGHCSGILVATDTVLTSAHCLWNKRTGRWYPAQYITFVAGAEKEEYQDYANASTYTIADGFKADQLANPATIKHDWALIKLEHPIGKKLGFLPIASNSDISQNHPLLQTGYRADRPYVLTVEDSCAIEAIFDNQQVLQTSCHTLGGDSGGPTLIMKDEQWLLLGIHRGRTDQNKSLVVTVKNFREALEQ